MAKRTKATRPSVTVNCVADNYAAPNQRIIEFSGNTLTQGGLIAFTIIDGKLHVRVYRQDKDVVVTVEKEVEPTPTILVGK